VSIADLGITNGLFTVALDFGSEPFDGSARWVQIAVRPGSSTGAYTNVVPRQQITSSPYAISAGRSPSCPTEPDGDVERVVTVQPATGSAARAR
jgi:hypothetical protein